VSRSKKKNYKNDDGAKREMMWPKKESLEDAIATFLGFQALCKHQMDLGYWATVDFPSKHHINKILSLQYMNRDFVDKIYGPTLAKRGLALIGVCKSYVDFARYVGSEDVDVK